MKVLKGTGPGSAMAIPSVPQQITLMQKAISEEKSLATKKASTSSALNKMYKVQVMTSADKIGHLRQLNCDTVTKNEILETESPSRAGLEISPIRVSRLRESVLKA